MAGGWGETNTCTCIAESLHSSPETTTTLLIGYTPIQNVLGVKNNNNNKIFLKRKNKTI